MDRVAIAQVTSTDTKDYHVIWTALCSGVIHAELWVNKKKVQDADAQLAARGILNMKLPPGKHMVELYADVSPESIILMVNEGYNHNVNMLEEAVAKRFEHEQDGKDN